MELDFKKALNIFPLRKIRKKDITQLLNEIIESKVIVSETAHHLIGFCLRYHLTNPKKIKNNQQWVLQACSKDETKKHILYPWISKPYICASDGHRMHLILNQDETIDDGCYLNLIKDLKVKISIPAEPPPAEDFLKIRKKRDNFQLLKLSELKYRNEKTMKILLETEIIYVSRKYIQETFAMDSEMLFSQGDVLIFESKDRSRICFLMPQRTPNGLN
jgi:hypothetical protein